MGTDAIRNRDWACEEICSSRLFFDLRGLISGVSEGRESLRIIRRVAEEIPLHRGQICVASLGCLLAAASLVLGRCTPRLSLDGALAIRVELEDREL